LRRARRAFTTIELLIAIAAIAILVGLVLLAMKSVTTGTRDKVTRTALNNARSMLSELEATSGLGSGPAEWLVGTAAAPTNVNATATCIYWKRANDVPGLETLEVSPGFVKEGGSDRDASPAVLNTTIIMGITGSVPANRAALQKLGADQQFVPTANAKKYPPGCRVKGTDGKFYRSTQRTSAAPPGGVWIEDKTPIPMLKDGWGNPIIFVPAAGLSVRTEAGGAAPVIITSPDHRPFFASAGPDGTFGFIDKNGNGTFEAGTDLPGGDDNLYSFEH
jgi:type II secretory pathway pseudopilin PulG